MWQGAPIGGSNLHFYQHKSDVVATLKRLVIRPFFHTLMRDGDYTYVVSFNTILHHLHH